MFIISDAIKIMDDIMRKKKCFFLLKLGVECICSWSKKSSTVVSVMLGTTEKFQYQMFPLLLCQLSTQLQALILVFLPNRTNTITVT